MSSRQLRKLQKQKELQTLESFAQEESESDDEPPIQKPKPSLFSNFATLGDEDEDEDEAVPEPESVADHSEQAEPVKTSAKKNKKKKKKAKKAAADTPTKDPIEAKTKGNDEVDEIDQAICELNLKAQASGLASDENVTADTVAYERICELLRVNTHHLKVINEMRSLFGREAIEAANLEEQEQEQNRTRRRGQQQLRQNVDLETFLKGVPGKPLPEVTLRRNPFLPGKETWPRASTDGLTMKQVKDGTIDKKYGTVEFGFAHDEQYNSQERQFFQLVQMYDPMQLVYFLHSHPYHVSTLIQVSKVAKQDQNNALAGDLCERALFTFGRVSISAFRQKLEEGKARLDFKRPENRQFWLAGYHYLKSLTMKGTYRTALEWTKLLLSMDLADPYGLIHFLHPLAIRAHESKWFIDFCDSEALDECDTAQDYIRQTLVLARLQQQDIAGAKALAVEGMERLPWLYSAIFKSLNLDVPRAIWGIEPRDEHEILFTDLYIHQTKQLWDNAQAVGLLKEAAALAQKPFLGSLPPTPVAGRNVGRFIYLDNTPALMALAPSGMLHSFPNWDFDPLPPAQEDNVFSYDSQKLPWSQDRPVPRAFNPSDVDDAAGLQRMLQQALRGGAPPEARQAIENALAEINAHLGMDGADAGTSDDDGSDNTDDNGDDENRETPPQQDGSRGIWQTFLNMVVGGPVLDEDDDDGDVAVGAVGGWPGAWPEEDEQDGSDDEMPALIPGPDARGGDGNDGGRREESN